MGINKRTPSLLHWMLVLIAATPWLATAESTLYSDSRFYPKEEVLMDLDQHIYWKICSVGQMTDAGQCIGTPERMVLEEAIALANKTDGWRLPTVQEYRSITLCRHPIGTDQYQPQSSCDGDYLTPTVNPVFIWVWPVRYWSHPQGSQATTFSFYTGEEISTPDEQKHMVLLVRDFIKGDPNAN